MAQFRQRAAERLARAGRRRAAGSPRSMQRDYGRPPIGLGASPTGRAASRSSPATSSRLDDGRPHAAVAHHRDRRARRARDRRARARSGDLLRRRSRQAAQPPHGEPVLSGQPLVAVPRSAAAAWRRAAGRRLRRGRADSLARRRCHLRLARDARAIALKVLPRRRPPSASRSMTLPAGPEGVLRSACSVRVKLEGCRLASVYGPATLRGAKHGGHPERRRRVGGAAVPRRASWSRPAPMRSRSFCADRAAPSLPCARRVAAGARFVLLDAARRARRSGGGARSACRYNWRVGPSTRDIGDASYVAATHTFQGLGLKPLSPVHVRGQRAGGDVTITWLRRTRIGGDSWETPEVPLGEDLESYEVDILDGDDGEAHAPAATPTVTYTAADQIADFGAAQPALRRARLSDERRLRSRHPPRRRCTEWRGRGPPWISRAGSPAPGTSWASSEIDGSARQPAHPSPTSATVGAAWPLPHDEVPWCAAFVGACLERAGIASTRSLMARSYLGWGAGARRRPPRRRRGVEPRRRSLASATSDFCWARRRPRLSARRQPGRRRDRRGLSEGAHSSGCAGRSRPRRARRRPPAARGPADAALSSPAPSLTSSKWKAALRDDPYDPGGPTNLGITLAVYADWKGVAPRLRR